MSALEVGVLRNPHYIYRGNPEEEAKEEAEEKKIQNAMTKASAHAILRQRWVESPLKFSLPVLGTLWEGFRKGGIMIYLLF
jgi:hypothetical protein